jgi:hypothetical protein
MTIMKNCSIFFTLCLFFLVWDFKSKASSFEGKEGLYGITKLKKTLQNKFKKSQKNRKNSFLHNDEIRFIQKEIDSIHEHLLSLEDQDSSANQKYLKGELDPNYPAELSIRPQFLPIPKKIGLPISGNVEIEEITISLLKELSSKKLKALLEHLSQIDVELKWKNKAGKKISGKRTFGIRFNPWEETNAAAALALAVGIKKDKELLTQMLILSPDAISLGLDKKAFAIFNGRMVCEALIQDIASINQENSREIASSAENVVQGYLKYWAEKDPHRLTLALTRFVLMSTKRMKKEVIPFNPQKKGILLGALLAAALQRAHTIKNKDEKRLWIINSVANLAWAASTFLGIIPLLGAQTAIIAGSLSVAVVSWSVIFSRIGVRDFTPSIKEIEGHIEFLALEAAQAKDSPVSILEILETLAWMRSTIHINGISD